MNINSGNTREKDQDGCRMKKNAENNKKLLGLETNFPPTPAEVRSFCLY